MLRNSTKIRLYNAFFVGKRSYSAQEKRIFDCPRKEFAKYINQYSLAMDKENFGSVFAFKDRLWTLYAEIKDDYEFKEQDLRTLLKLIPYFLIEEDLKLKRVQELIDRMINLGYNPDGDGLVALITAHASSPNAMDKIEGLLYSWKHSPPQTKRVYNILLRVYARIHGTEAAEQWFDSLIGTMIYTETGVIKSLRPLIKDGGIYTQLIRMYCEEGNLPAAIKKFNEMFRKFDQSNRSGALGRIMMMLLKEGKYYETLAWFTTAKLYYMHFDETGYFRVLRAVLLYALSKNMFISANDVMIMFGEFGSHWRPDEKELCGIRRDHSDLDTLISDLNVDKVVGHQVPKESLYYSEDNCLDTEKQIENALDFENMDGMEGTESNVPNFVQEMSDLFKNQKFGDNTEVDQDVMPLEYDRGFLKLPPREMLKIILSDSFEKTEPSIVSLNAFLYVFYKVGALEDCVKLFDYIRKRLEIYADPTTNGLMARVYNKLGEHGKAAALAQFDHAEIMEGDLVAIGTQFDVMLSSGRHQELEGIFKEMDDSRDIGARNMTIALRMYIKENKMDDAKRLFERIVATQMEEGKPTSHPFNIMMSKYAQMGDMFSFNALISQMSDMGIELEEDTYVHIMKAYLHWNDPETALEYYRKMISQELFAKMNNQKGMIDIIKTMISKGVIPNEHTLTLIVGYYVNLGNVEEAQKVQDLFRKIFPHLSSSMRCHNIIINHYTKLENRAGVLRELHRATSVYKAVPDLSTYTCMIKVFAMTDLKAARKIFEIALDKCRNGYLDAEIFATMMEASYDAGDYNSAMEIYTRMNALDVNPDQKVLKIYSRLQALTPLST